MNNNFLRVLTIALLVAGCQPATPPDEPFLFPELMALYESRNYFQMREQLQDLKGEKTAEVGFYRAAVQHAFNELSLSNTTIDTLLDDKSLPENLYLKLQRLRLRNQFRLFQYPQAYETSQAILSYTSPSPDPGEFDDVRNTARILKALLDVPPQQATIRSATVLEKDNGGHIPLQIGRYHRSYALDTAANLSVLMRSEAEALGLRIREAGVEVGTSTDVKVHADLAVAEQVTIGNIDYQHVVFLVFPDEALTFPEHNFRIPGLIGFPLIEAMGEITFRGDKQIEIPAETPDRALHNLVLEQLSPLLKVQYGQETIVCQLDTGADKTAFYEPFFQRYRTEIEALDNFGTSKTGGVGGIREIPAYRLPEIELKVGGVATRITEVDVYTLAITETKENYLFCNIGRDLLDQFGTMILNFRSMSLVLD